MHSYKKVFFMVILTICVTNMYAIAEGEVALFQQLHQEMQENFVTLNQELSRMHQEATTMHQEIMNKLDENAARIAQLSIIEPPAIVEPQPQEAIEESSIPVTEEDEDNNDEKNEQDEQVDTIENVENDSIENDGIENDSIENEEDNDTNSDKSTDL